MTDAQRERIMARLAKRGWKVTVKKSDDSWDALFTAYGTHKEKPGQIGTGMTINEAVLKLAEKVGI